MPEVVAVDSPSAARPSGRYLFIDALRGIAAVLVMMHHLLHTTVMDVTFHRAFPNWFLAICEIGNHGVQIFFVISGFVIAHSIRGIIPNGAGAVNFIVRRQVRLDPPYWAMLTFTLCDMVIEQHVPSLVHHPMPSVRDVVLHFLYLQNIVGAKEINNIAWTLCLEIQFYLLFIIATIVGARLSRSRANPSAWTVALVTLSGLGCLACFHQQRVLAPWFPSFWPYFVFGAVCYWATHRLLPTGAFAAYAIIFAAVTVWSRSGYMLFGLGTGLSIFAVAKANRLRTFGSNAVLQYLGGISYSLYLVHPLVLSVILRGGYKLTHENRLAAVGWFFVAAAASVVLADVFHRLIEVPSMRWSSQLKPPQRRASVVPAIPAVAVT